MRYGRSELCSSDLLREHVAGVVVCPVLAPKRKWLAWRPAGNELNLTLVALEVDNSDIAFCDLAPIFEGFDLSREIIAKGVTAIAIPLNDIEWGKACLMETDS